VADDFERMSSAYVNESSQTYQKVVIHKDGGYSYEQEKEPGKERQLNKTTVWRWVGYLGRKAQELKDAMEVICQRASNHFAMSRPLIIPQRKYRSKCRKHLLESAGLLLRINRIWTELSGRTIFPRLATPASNFYYILSAMG